MVALAEEAQETFGSPAMAFFFFRERKCGSASLCMKSCCHEIHKALSVSLRRRKHSFLTKDDTSFVMLNNIRSEKGHSCVRISIRRNTKNRLLFLAVKEEKKKKKESCLHSEMPCFFQLHKWD